MMEIDLARTQGGHALMVMRNGGEFMLCPFFGKCDGLLFMDPDDLSLFFVPGHSADAEEICDQIIATRIKSLICGFVPSRQRDRLRAAGIDVRLGSCSCKIDDLLIGRENLPEA